jgi:cytochrome c biogenesis protein CcdA
MALTMRNNNSRKVILISAILITTGIMIVFLLIGVLFSISSSFIGEFLLLNYAFFAKLQASFLIIAGILMIRSPQFISKITLPSRLEMYSQRIFEKENPFLSSFLIGTIYAIIAAPCASGIFVLVWSEMLLEPLGSQLLIVLFFAVGSGLPFFIMGIYMPSFTSGFMKSVHNARNKMMIGLGVILILAGMWLFLSETPNSYLNFN